MTTQMTTFQTTTSKTEELSGILQRAQGDIRKVAALNALNCTNAMACKAIAMRLTQRKK